MFVLLSTSLDQEICGSISQEASVLTELKAGTPVIAGAGDQAAGAVGIGITKAGIVSATIGTSGVVFAATDHPAMGPKGGRALVLSCNSSAMARHGG
jgi:sugar (pentulose or hexulose) kinase